MWWKRRCGWEFSLLEIGLLLFLGVGRVDDGVLGKLLIRLIQDEGRLILYFGLILWLRGNRSLLSSAIGTEGDIISGGVGLRLWCNSRYSHRNIICRLSHDLLVVTIFGRAAR